LQALRCGQPVDPFADPGEADLTAHVDFSALASSAGVPAFGPVPQGVWLGRLGIEARAARLRATANLAERAAIDAALVRLTGSMGTLFKALALAAPDWPRPAGF
jgi:NADH dehydrogenase [ubiquinone] 1 alpha subcomplex assembly factor 7